VAAATTTPRVSPTERTATYRVLAALTKPLVRVLFRPQAQGLEHVPKSGGFVLSSNQLSNLDGAALSYALFPRQVWWMAKAELFAPVLGSIVRTMGCFPVRRGEGDLGAVRTAVELALRGYAVGIFPEGTRRAKGLRKKHQARLHSGAARVALAADVPLVPAAIVGTDKLTALRRWRIAFGEPVLVDDLPDNPRLAARETTQRLGDAIGALETELLGTRRGSVHRLRPRLLPDISSSDLRFALRACLRPGGPGDEQRLLEAWAGGESGLACLSVRSGFDLLLEALAFEPGDEIAVSAITHPDMIRVLEAHGLRALPVDVDPDTLTPRAELLEGLIGPRTRALVVAHLFGGRADLEQLAEVTDRHGLLLIEDCAQSFRGPEDRGSPLADVSLFSFGAIKTATALGGALVRVGDPGLLARMRRIQGGWPVQSHREYAARLLKFAGLLTLARPRAYWLFERSVRLARRDFDSFVNGSVKGFPGPELLARIRRRPSPALLALVERRLSTFDRERLARRERLGERVADALPAPLFHPGRTAPERTHWVFPVVVPERMTLTRALRHSGFDAATATSSLAAVPAPADRPELAPRAAARMMSDIVFLPLYPELAEPELDDMLAAIARACE
jgi:dTDP-4-amino-4,6-dideoxygalactose transaminase